MDHFYKTIPGYFSFPDFYSWLAREFPGGHGVEVGSYAGRSAAYLAVELFKVASESKWPRLDLVDTFTAGPGREAVIASLAPAKPLIGGVFSGDSAGAATMYGDASLDWVYIDADHHYEAVRRDILAWLPKVKQGGIIAGHDYAEYEGFGVVRAVTEIFPRVEVWRGEIFDGDGIRDFSHDAAWLGRYYPTWSARV